MEIAMSEPESSADKSAEISDEPLTDREVYNVVTDLYQGVNFRYKDNLYQGLCILAGLVLGALLGVIVGAVVATDHWQGALLGAAVGGFIGVLVGLFGSGIFLMVYRALRHFKGKHD